MGVIKREGFVLGKLKCDDQNTNKTVMLHTTGMHTKNTEASAQAVVQEREFK